MKVPQVWRVLQVLRENPEGVESVFLTKKHLDLYHKFASRCSDLKKKGYVISCEKAGGADWNYRWKLMNPEYTGNPGEPQTAPQIPVKPYTDKTGRMYFNFGAPL